LRSPARRLQSLAIGQHTNEVIREREARGGVDSRHVTAEAVLTLFSHNMSPFILVAAKARMAVHLGRVALCVAVRRMTGSAFDFAFQVAGTHHQAEGLETDTGDIALVTWRRLQPVAFATELNLGHMVKRTRINGHSVAASVLFGPRVATNTLNAGGQPSQVLAYGGGMTIEASAGISIRLDQAKCLYRTL
jgi:hypothetical protein